MADEGIFIYIIQQKGTCLGCFLNDRFPYIYHVCLPLFKSACVCHPLTHKPDSHLKCDTFSFFLFKEMLPLSFRVQCCYDRDKGVSDPSKSEGRRSRVVKEWSPKFQGN